MQYSQYTAMLSGPYHLVMTRSLVGIQNEDSQELTAQGVALLGACCLIGETWNTIMEVQFE